jgi:hypothetical protein
METSEQIKAWHIAKRWQEFDGEMRSALLRIILVLLFYSVQIAHYLNFENVTEQSHLFHRAATLAATAWLMISLGVVFALRSEFMPSAMKYVVTALDLGIITMLALLGSGPNSPLVATYFLILVLATLRFRIGLVWFTTITSMICYLLLVGSIDPHWFDENHTTPFITLMITECSLASTGIVLGQIIRSSRFMSRTFHDRLKSSGRAISS